eukprot:365130-Chlamydomonas_euryale.AAC.37
MQVHETFVKIWKGGRRGGGRGWMDEGGAWEGARTGAGRSEGRGAGRSEGDCSTRSWHRLGIVRAATLCFRANC